MKLETILQAAVNSMIHGHHKPHCFSAHELGHGYTNDGSNPATRAEYLKQLQHRAECEIENIGFAPDYAEPGYDSPDKAVLFANWNCLPRNLDTILERLGYAVEWSDEWMTCEDCGRAVRTSPDGYDWTPFYKIENDCEVLCLDCLKN